MMSRAEVGGTLDFPDIITPDPFQFAYMQRHSNDSRSDLLSVWSNQMQEKQDS